MLLLTPSCVPPPRLSHASIFAGPAPPSRWLPLDSLLLPDYSCSLPLASSSRQVVGQALSLWRHAMLGPFSAHTSCQSFPPSRSSRPSASVYSSRSQVNPSACLWSLCHLAPRASPLLVLPRHRLHWRARKLIYMLAMPTYSSDIMQVEMVELYDHISELDHHWQNTFLAYAIHQLYAAQALADDDDDHGQHDETAPPFHVATLRLSSVLYASQALCLSLPQSWPSFPALLPPRYGPLLHPQRLFLLLHCQPLSCSLSIAKNGSSFSPLTCSERPYPLRDIFPNHAHIWLLIAWLCSAVACMIPRKLLHRERERGGSLALAPRWLWPTPLPRRGRTHLPAHARAHLIRQRARLLASGGWDDISWIACFIPNPPPFQHLQVLNVLTFLPPNMPKRSFMLDNESTKHFLETTP